MTKKTNFKKKLLASAVASCALAGLGGAAVAQEQAIVEEVVVLGVRGAQETAINIKRSAASVVDAISAEDIGRLPDVTIADSLQRIPGVQITRSAGEGGSVNVRGLPQVVTQLNGEQYLGAGSITSVQPNFGDIPSQLFKGAEVHKSATANLAYTGITGTVNLQTRRPFDFDHGISGAGSFEIQTGDETGEMDPVISGLVNWRNDQMGFLFAAAYANVNLANSYNGFNTTDNSGGAGWVNGANDWGAQYDYNIVSPQGIATWHQETERERLGLNASFQADLGEGFEFIADWFYTQQDEYNRKAGLELSNRWQSLDWFTSVEGRLTGDSGGAGGHVSDEWMSAQVYNFDVWRTASYSQNNAFFSDSNNLNLQLNFDNGGKITGSARFILASAEQQHRHGYTQGDLSDWGDGVRFQINPFYPGANSGQTVSVPGVDGSGHLGGGFVDPNPQGYSADPQLRYDTRGTHPVWSGWDDHLPGGINNGQGGSLREYMANLESYTVGAYSSEGNFNRTADLNVFRVDGSYAFDQGGFLTSVDVGLRNSVRQSEQEVYHLFSPFYNEQCTAQWKAIDVVLNNPVCQAGEMVDGEFQGYTALTPQRLDNFHNVIWMDDFGPISSIPGVWVADPRDYDDSEAFHNRVFGSTEKAIVPGSSFTVDMRETTLYAQANFEAGIMTGNLGLRVIETDLTVKRNETGDNRPYGDTNRDIGDTVDRRSYTDILPSLNLAFGLTDDVILRFAAGQTMTPLNLNQWGDGLRISTSIAPELGEGIFVVNSASQGGNPELDPWRATNVDLSLEWYLGAASMANIGFFYVDVDSFTQSGTIPMDLPDSDGIVRRTTDVETQVQGDGGSLQGVELGTKLAFGDFMGGIIGDFGLDTNYTYSPSTQNQDDISGSALPFPENSEHQFNLIGWYQGERFQARIAYNYRSDRLAGVGITSGNLALYQKATAYVDASASYDVTDAVTVYVNASNLTGEFEEYYLQWEDQYAYQLYFEPRYTLGVRARF